MKLEGKCAKCPMFSPWLSSLPQSCSVEDLPPVRPSCTRILTSSKSRLSCLLAFRNSLAGPGTQVQRRNFRSFGSLTSSSELVLSFLVVGFLTTGSSSDEDASLPAGGARTAGLVVGDGVSVSSSSSVSISDEHEGGEAGAGAGGGAEAEVGGGELGLASSSSSTSSSSSSSSSTIGWTGAGGFSLGAASSSADREEEEEEEEDGTGEADL